ncbi:MAG: hypothetical protein IKX40_06675 [Thermoguttaceae bacterium]|nr:hypothetical protein [Thermoguttaceae bacterium]
MKKWDEMDSECERFIVLSYYGQTDFVFSIGKLPDFRYDEANSIHEEYLKRLKRAYREYLKRKGYTGYSHDIRLVWKLGLTDIEIESLLQDRRPVRQWLQNVAIKVKEELESIVRFKAERMAELDDDSDSNGADSASVENIPSFPIDSFSPVVPDGSVPVPFVASRKDMVPSCTSEVKQPDDESTRHLRNIDKEDKQHTKQLTSIQTVLQDGKEILREGFAMVVEEIRQAAKSAEQTPPPSPEQTAFEIMKKEYYSITGKGYVGRRRLLLFEKYGMKVSEIWEFETGDCWEDLNAGERAAFTHKIEQAIDRAERARESQS